MQIPLVAVSRPLHSGVCETRQDAGLPVIHSAISDSGRLRTRGGQLPSARLGAKARKDDPSLMDDVRYSLPGFRPQPRVFDGAPASFK